jgi:hypothetical protein
MNIVAELSDLIHFQSSEGRVSDQLMSGQHSVGSERYNLALLLNELHNDG